MRNLAIAVVDSFSEKPFSGNPAAVCLLESPLLTSEMQAIAMEMNLSETAFVEKTKEEGSFSLRWFTPKVEIDLCEERVKCVTSKFENKVIDLERVTSKKTTKIQGICR